MWRGPPGLIDSNASNGEHQSLGLAFEPLSFESVPIDSPMVLFQELINEGKHIRILNSKRQPFAYNEKQIRDAAAAEVAQFSVSHEEEKGKKRKHLNPDEKVQQNRDRNREHAKNTRLRKKAYVLKLKELVDHLSQQKNMEECERQVLGEKISDTHVLRKNAVRLFLLYRSACVTDRSMWSSILDEGVVMSLPITPFRSFSRPEIKFGQRTVNGIDAIINDTCSLNLMAEVIGINSDLWKNSIKRGECCRIMYSMQKEEIMAAADAVMCRFMLKTEGHQLVGAQSACIVHAMLRCRFNRFNKISKVEISYDVMGFMQQLQRASVLSPEKSIVPNTLDMALQFSTDARLIMKSSSPYFILHVNESFTNITSKTQAECEGRPILSVLKLMSGLENDFITMLEATGKGMPGSRLIFCRNIQSARQKLTNSKKIMLSNNGAPSAVHGYTEDDVLSYLPSDAVAMSSELYNNDTYNNTQVSDSILMYVRCLPLSAENGTTGHILAVFTPLPFYDNDSDNLLSQTIGYRGPIASQPFRCARDAVWKNLPYFESEYRRQQQSFAAHYNSPSIFTQPSIRQSSTQQACIPQPSMLQVNNSNANIQDDFRSSMQSQILPQQHLNTKIINSSNNNIHYPLNQANYYYPQYSALMSIDPALQAQLVAQSLMKPGMFPPPSMIPQSNPSVPQTIQRSHVMMPTDSNDNMSINSTGSIGTMNTTGSGDSSGANMRMMLPNMNISNPTMIPQSGSQSFYPAVGSATSYGAQMMPSQFYPYMNPGFGFSDGNNFGQLQNQQQQQQQQQQNLSLQSSQNQQHKSHTF